MLSAQRFVTQDSFDKGFFCDSLGLAILSYVNIFQGSRTQWWALK